MKDEITVTLEVNPHTFVLGTKTGIYLMTLPENGDLLKSKKVKIEGDTGRVNSLIKLGGERVGIASAAGIFDFYVGNSEVRLAAEILDD